MSNQETNNDPTAQHILTTALYVYLTQGIKKTSVDDIAKAAGITRVTVYRHYGNKEELVKAVMQFISANFEYARTYVENDPEITIDAIIDILGNTIAMIPSCDFPARLDELKRIYPAIFQSFHETRLTTLEVLFERMFTMAEEQNLLRSGLNRQVVQTYFMETVVNIIESPRLIALGLTPDQIFQTVKSIFLHGILKGE